MRNKRQVPYGFGFRIVEKDDSKMVYHNGLWNGFRTSIIRYMTDSCTIIVLNNTNSDTKQMLVRDIENILMGEENIPADELSKATLLEEAAGESEEDL